MITGGAGFIGSHITKRMCEAYPDSHVVVLDKMTYAADINYVLPLISSGRIELVVGDICDFELCKSVIAHSDFVIHAAAESHVDRSFHNSILFTYTNAYGTHTIMEACRSVGVPRIVAKMICREFNVPFESHVEFVNDRPFNDRRYAISWAKLADLGWKPRRRLPDQLPAIVDWYKKNAEQLLRKMDQALSNGT